MSIRINVAAATLVALLTLPCVVLAQPVLLPSASLTGDDPDGTLAAFGDVKFRAGENDGQRHAC